MCLRGCFGHCNPLSVPCQVIFKAMEKGETLAILVGGFQEATICARGHERVFVKSRKGFVK